MKEVKPIRVLVAITLSVFLLSGADPEAYAIRDYAEIETHEHDTQVYVPHYPDIDFSPRQRAYSASVEILAEKISKWKRRSDHNIWFECGKRYEKHEILPAALEWADALIRATRSTSYRYKKRDRKVSLTEAMGIIVNESRFDRCALGPNPRKWAYEKGILTKPEGHFPSHSLEEIERLYNHPKFSRRKADIGVGQIVHEKKLPWKKAKDYFTVNPGVQLFVDEMARRGRMYRTTRPSSRWPGSINHLWYTDKILDAARVVLDK